MLDSVHEEAQQISASLRDAALDKRRDPGQAAHCSGVGVRHRPPPPDSDTDRNVAQWAENDHRAALTDTDRLAAVEQLSAFGVSAAQITGVEDDPRSH